MVLRFVVDVHTTCFGLHGHLQVCKICICIYISYMAIFRCVRYVYVYVRYVRCIYFHLKMVVRPKHVADNLNKIVNSYWNRVALDGKTWTWSNTRNRMQTPKFRQVYVMPMEYTPRSLQHQTLSPRNVNRTEKQSPYYWCMRADLWRAETNSKFAETTTKLYVWMLLVCETAQSYTASKNGVRTATDGDLQHSPPPKKHYFHRDRIRLCNISISDINHTGSTR
jgi:hypothetical protein